jgi:uncharacterized membrane protein YqhA
VIVVGYENFISKIERPAYDGLPSGLTDTQFSVLEQMRLGAVVAIAAVEARAWWTNIPTPRKLGWALACSLVPIGALLMFAIADRFGRCDPESA